MNGLEDIDNELARALADQFLEELHEDLPRDVESLFGITSLAKSSSVFLKRSNGGLHQNAAALLPVLVVVLLHALSNDVLAKHHLLV